MPVERQSARAALDARRKNKRAKWPGRDSTGAHFSPIAFPAFDPTITLHPDDQIFCIGSCFAREIEAVLARFGYQVLSKPLADPPTGRLDLNKYTVPSILNELRHVFEPAQYDAAPFIITAPDGSAADYQLTGGLRPRGMDVARATRTAASAHFAQIKQASFVVITLGYSEVWFDTDTGLYLNRAPVRALIEAAPERFELRVMSAEETATDLRSVLDLLAKHMPKGLRAMLTVSPVPLQATFRTCDVMLANAYSKSALRCAVDVVLPDYDWAEYFPSYEMATLSTPALVWSDADFRHLNRDFVTLIMSHVLDGLLPGDQHQHHGEQQAAHARLLARHAGGASHRPHLWHRMESRLLTRILSPIKLRKYQRDRAAFFEDSKNSLARWYWRRRR